jgi:steroid delta-isomerase
MQRLQALIELYENLTPERVKELESFYAEDAYFKDPFNEVRGLHAIGRIFRHMFRQVSDPRFIITERIVADNGAVLVWEFRFRMRQWRVSRVQSVRGVTHLRFDTRGCVTYHRDYWDAAEELYSKLPLLGGLMRTLQKSLRA